MRKKCAYVCETDYSSEKSKSDKILVNRFPRCETETEKGLKFYLKLI